MFNSHQELRLNRIKYVFYGTNPRRGGCQRIHVTKGLKIQKKVELIYVIIAN